MFSGNELEDFGEIVMNIALYIPVGVLAAAGSLEWNNKNSIRQAQDKRQTPSCDQNTSNAAGDLTKTKINPSGEDEPFGFGANASEFPCESSLSQINSATSSPVGYTNSSSPEAKNQRFAKNHWFWKVVLIGIFTSIVVELLQLITKTGMCETDDVICNTIGCAIGAGTVLKF